MSATFNNPSGILKNVIPPRARWALIGLSVILSFFCTMHVIFGYSHQNSCVDAWGTDDAFISYRYAQNLAEGNGLVFNPGERVEGYSNLLYILILTPSLFFSHGIGIYSFSVLMNIVFLASAFLIFSRYLFSISLKYAIWGCLLFVFYPPFWSWSASGLETTLVLMLQISICYYITRQVNGETSNRLTFLLSILMVVSVLTRADGFILPMIAIAFLIIKGEKKLTLIYSTVLAFSIVSLLIWRYGYYHDLLPNTYYAKVSGSIFDRIHYAAELLLVISFFQGLLPYFIIHLVTIIVSIPLLFRKISLFRENLNFEFIFSILWMAYWIFLGGDVYFERFLIVLVPFGISSMIKIFETIKAGKAFAIMTLLILVFQLSTILTDKRFEYTLSKNDCMVNLGQFLGREFPKATLAIGAAGKPSYFSNLYTIDMFGLNNSYIGHLPEEEIKTFRQGHTKYSPDYVFSEKPDFIGGWITNPQFDLDAGLVRKIYVKNGFEIRYLVYSRPTIQNQPAIREVHPEDIPNLKLFVEQGYGYAVLAKK